MSSEKNTTIEIKKARRTHSELEALSDNQPTPGVEVVSLEIEEELDSGSDPYNRTGSFCVIKASNDD